MHIQLIWSVFICATYTVLVETCPDGCQCSVPFTIFCSSRKNPSFPRNIPQNTLSLYLFENGISSIEESSFSGLWDLQLLDLSHNKLSHLPGGVFKSLANLSNLDLSSNQITEISAETFQGLGRLERLYLIGNQIRSIHPDAFRGLENLLELKLSQNQLVVAPAFSLPHLLLLDLSYNTISTIQPGVFHASNIETLKLAGLGLKEVPADLLSGLKNLHDLDLSHNQLSKVPPGLRGLTKLNLAGNAAISQLQPEDFSVLTGLQDLDLSGLNLRTLPKGLFQSSKRLRGISLAQNPFNCVCLLSWLTEWLRVSGVALLRSDETRCHFPPKNAGKILRNLQSSDFGCPIPTTVFVPTTLAPTSTAPPPTTTTSKPTARPTTIPTTTIPAVQTEIQHPEIPTPYDQLCPPQTCLNGGFCMMNSLGEIECECPAGFYGMYCEMLSLTPFAEQPLLQLQVIDVTSSSIKIDLQSYIENKKHLPGLRLTVQNLSVPEHWSVTYSLPPSIPYYSLTQLSANSTYRLCLETMYDVSAERELCTEAQTLSESPKSSAHINQSRDGNLTLVLVPAAAAGILLVVVIVSAVCYARRRREKAHAGENGGPLEMEGVKMALEEKSELKKLSDSSNGPDRGWQTEEPLMDSTRIVNNNDAPTGRLPHSYF
ncbi:vasorin [Rana temporaria]|uniref:vasorin n=1 Tax=Rana temporaria TaxID=8407 RepID=UPI001AACA8B1|nr:vasorin [Rana temporaria]